MWSGQQIVYEMRAAWSSSEIDGYPGVHYGRVGYLHVAGIDQPIALWKGGQVVQPHLSARGVILLATCGLDLCDPTTIDISGPRLDPFGADSDPPPDGPPSWYGSLITGQQDASGLLYRRNRYVDPVTGTFTETEPIGLAGGLNLHGYADGDPVPYSDPFAADADEGGEDPCRPFIDDEEKYDECEKGAKPFKAIGRSIGESEQAQKLFGCMREHYGSGGLLGPVRGGSYVGAIPVDKAAIGIPRVLGKTSSTTNLISAAGAKVAPHLTMSRVGLPRTLGSNRVFGVLGRANLLLAAGITSYDVTSVGTCVFGGGER